MKYKSFHPGQPWLDTNGKRIHAHGGSIFYENGRYYWYGENKEKRLALIRSGTGNPLLCLRRSLQLGRSWPDHSAGAGRSCVYAAPK